MRLLWLEIKRLFNSLAFLIYSALVFAFIVINVNPMMNRSLAHIPAPNDYDSIYATDFRTIKTSVLDQLTTEYTMNSYTTYPLGFAKTTSLAANKRNQMRTKIIALRQAPNRPTLNATLKLVDQLLGGHSSYTPSNVVTLASRQMTSREAKHDYHLILERDKISGAFARVFADIATLIVGILPTVIVLAFCADDRRSHAAAAIHSKAVSRNRRLLTRYAASLLVLLLPVLAVSVYLTIQVVSSYPHRSLDLLAFMKAAIIWVLPTLMVSSAVGFLTYELFGNFLGFAGQICWWLVTMMLGARRVDGYYGLLLMPRHNSLHNVAYFYEHLNDLLLNRASYVLLALIMIGITMLIGQIKKGGYLIALSRH
ncbi:ABC transporter permease [Lapidilactobacillus bayanensis]|uniref:ABC transporter permease n=1 Tax=Lapidilactobacillus bayanensis TaxID=2485998 RepID=UPI000F79A4AF|nr:ABC transporter permease [Lapidilactobacillus bayanensis]